MKNYIVTVEIATQAENSMAACLKIEKALGLTILDAKIINAEYNGEVNDPEAVNCCGNGCCN